MIRARSTVPGVCLVLALAVTMAPPCHSADDFYAGKTVSIVVGSSPGGGFDTNARTVARYLGNHVPGRPTVIIRNMPGAGGLISVRYLDASAPQDGTVITVFNPGIVTASVITPDKTELDFRNFAWVGVVTPEFRVCFGYGPNGVKSWDDLMRRTAAQPFIIGSTAKGAGNYINGATLREVFGANVKHILGFPGSAEERLAIERGELDGSCGTWSSIPVKWVEQGDVHAFVRFSEDRPPEIPERAAYVGTFAKTGAQKQLLEVLNGADEVGRPFIMSKKVPMERVAILRNAFNDTMKDKNFLAEMAKQRLPVDPKTGEEAEHVIEKMMDVPSIIAQARKIYE